MHAYSDASDEFVHAYSDASDEMVMHTLMSCCKIFRLCRSMRLAKLGVHRFEAFRHVHVWRKVHGLRELAWLSAFTVNGIVVAAAKLACDPALAPSPLAGGAEGAALQPPLLSLSIHMGCGAGCDSSNILA